MNEILSRGIQKDHLEKLAKHKGFKFTDTFFPYTSGQIGPYYVNSERIMKNGRDYSIAILDLRRTIQSTGYKFDAISGGERRDWIFSLPVARKMKKIPIMICKDGSTIGIEKEDVKGKRVIHVADLNNEGSSPRDVWIPTIRGSEGTINHIFFYVDRLEDGVEVMKKIELESHSIVPLDNYAWDYLKEINIISSEIYKNLRERGESKESRNNWAIKMLRSDKGFTKLAELANNPETIEKAKNILNKGYPELRLELTHKLMNQYKTRI